MRDPRTPIVRKVFLYPASGGEPHIAELTFNEAGAKHRHEIYSTAIDLRDFMAPTCTAVVSKMLTSKISQTR